MAERFDPAKDAVNRVKHGLPLIFGDRVFSDSLHRVFRSFRPVDGEDRFKAVGMVDGKLYTAVYVWRDGVRRFMSVRRSNDGEARDYRDSSRPER